MAKFFIRSAAKSGNANLYVKVARPKLGVQWMINTEISVSVNEWTKAQSGAKYLTKYFTTEEGKKVQRLMATVEDVIKMFFDGDSVDNDSKESLINEIHAVKAKAAEEKNKLCKVLNYYEYFQKGIEDGSIRHGEQKRYKKNSISRWLTFGKHLKGFLEYRHNLNITFEDIDRRTAAAFVTFLESDGLMKATIAQQTNHFRKLCNMAAEDGKNRNGTSLKVWKSHEQKDEEKRAEIVLSDDEINALYNLKLSGYVEQCRDLWILGFFSGQRVSDFSNFSKDNFIVNGYGTPVIRLRQIKTETEVEVPTLNEWDVTLLCAKERNKEKWYMETKRKVKAGEVLQGEELKRYRRCEEYAKEHESGEFLYRRNYKGEVIRQRWELVTCHTSRRSMITTLHKSGLLSDREIMSISGHSTIKNFEKYMKVKKAERATSIYEKFKKAKEI